MLLLKTGLAARREALNVKGNPSPHGYVARGAMMGTDLLPLNEAATWGVQLRSRALGGTTPLLGLVAEEFGVVRGSCYPPRVKMRHSPACSTASLPRVSFKAKDSKAR